VRLHPTLVVLLAALPLACVRSGAHLPPPAGLRTIVVAPPEDRTGTVLGGTRYLERLLGQPHTMLADVLAAEVRAALSRRGFSVAGGDAATDEAADTAADAGSDAGSDEATDEGADPATDAPTDEVARATTAATSTAGADGATLTLEVRRWEPDIPTLRFVLVSLDARLSDGEGGSLLWSVWRDDWQIPTRGAPTPEAASAMAARAVAEALVEGWRPAT